VIAAGTASLAGKIMKYPQVARESRQSGRCGIPDIIDTHHLIIRDRLTIAMQTDVQF
jgi:hypothetical protein